MEEGVDVLGFAGDGVEEFTGNRRTGRESSDDMNRLHEVALMRTRIEVGASETSTRTAAGSEQGDKFGENRWGENRWNGRGENG